MTTVLMLLFLIFGFIALFMPGDTFRDRALSTCFKIFYRYFVEVRKSLHEILTAILVIIYFTFMGFLSLYGNVFFITLYVLFLFNSLIIITFHAFKILNFHTAI